MVLNFTKGVLLFMLVVKDLPEAVLDEISTGFGTGLLRAYVGV